MIEIIRYSQKDLQSVLNLFYDTVHSVNAADYTKEQLDVWAPVNADAEKWTRSFALSYAVTAWVDGVLAGFGDITEAGYLDRLYVGKDFQRQGVGSALCDALENAFPVTEITVHASVTALPFFEERGYRIITRQQVERKGVTLENCVMKKSFY